MFAEGLTRNVGALSRFFDAMGYSHVEVGIAGALSEREIAEPKGERFGRAFEHFIHMEILAYRSYSEL